ncbi:uncharacterized protein ARMOST_10095 [Armillaria ostoyae]|uniref:Uncharacterized protein n=1 Tax=Armillaria ostoyae TaxID=47428 RepID=A0A284RDC3_ARMOS|nr:uncharacterized protein ARMOST_10095 [Armillaria ostoyae]
MSQILSMRKKTFWGHTWLLLPNRATLQPYQEIPYLPMHLPLTHPLTIHASHLQPQLTRSPDEMWSGAFSTEPLPQNPAQLPSSLLHLNPQAQIQKIPGQKTPLPYRRTPIPYQISTLPKPYSYEPSLVPMQRMWHITNGVIGGGSWPSTNESSSSDETG